MKRIWTVLSLKFAVLTSCLCFSANAWGDAPEPMDLEGGWKVEMSTFYSTCPNVKVGSVRKTAFKIIQKASRSQDDDDVRFIIMERQQAVTRKYDWQRREATLPVALHFRLRNGGGGMRLHLNEEDPERLEGLFVDHQSTCVAVYILDGERLDEE